MNKAMTLVETTIAMSLFATMLIVVTESAISVGRYITFHERAYNLEEEARIILRQLSADLSNAAWYYEVPNEGQPSVPIYPRVVRSADPLSTFGDEFHFLKLRTERTIGAPNRLDVEHVNLSNTDAVLMSDYAVAEPVYSLVLNNEFVDNGSAIFVGSVWESNQAGLTYAQNKNRENLRHYRYTVVLDPVTGRGSLVRSYVNGKPPDDGGNTAWQSDDNQRWGSHIASLTFDTMLTTRGVGQSRLGPNQIRVVLELRGDDESSGEILRRTFNATIALRSITNEITN